MSISSGGCVEGSTVGGGLIVDGGLDDGLWEAMEAAIGESVDGAATCLP